MYKKQLPNATTVMVLGIISIVASFCYGFVGIILGIIAIVLSKKDMKLYKENPEEYDGFNNLNTGRICGIIGLCIGSVIFILAIIYLVFMATFMFPLFQQAAQMPHV